MPHQAASAVLLEGQPTGYCSTSQQLSQQFRAAAAQGCAAPVAVSVTENLKTGSKPNETPKNVKTVNKNVAGEKSVVIGHKKDTRTALQGPGTAAPPRCPGLVPVPCAPGFQYS